MRHRYTYKCSITLLFFLHTHMAVRAQRGIYQNITLLSAHRYRQEQTACIQIKALHAFMHIRTQVHDFRSTALISCFTLHYKSMCLYCISSYKLSKKALFSLQCYFYLLMDSSRVLFSSTSVTFISQNWSKLFCIFIQG